GEPPHGGSLFAADAGDLFERRVPAAGGGAEQHLGIPAEPGLHRKPDRGAAAGQHGGGGSASDFSGGVDGADRSADADLADGVLGASGDPGVLHHLLEAAERQGAGGAGAAGGAVHGTAGGGVHDGIPLAGAVPGFSQRLCFAGAAGDAAGVGVLRGAAAAVRGEPVGAGGGAAAGDADSAAAVFGAARLVCPSRQAGGGGVGN